MAISAGVGEFGSERLVQQIVDSIMKATEKSLEQVTGHHPPTPDEEKANPFNKEEGEGALSPSLFPIFYLTPTVVGIV